MKSNGRGQLDSKIGKGQGRRKKEEEHVNSADLLIFGKKFLSKHRYDIPAYL